MCTKTKRSKEIVESVTRKGEFTSIYIYIYILYSMEAAIKYEEFNSFREHFVKAEIV